MKWHIGWMLAALAVATANAQTNSNPVDFWAATEVVMSQIGPSTMQQIQSSPALQQQYKNVLLEQHLAQEAVKRGLTERLDVQRALNVARRSVLVQALRDDLLRGVPAPTDADIAAAFPKGKEKWVLPEAYQLDVYRIAASDTPAHEAARRLANGGPVTDEALGKLVNAQAQVTRESGGWVSESQMIPAIWTALAEMKMDEVRLFPDGAQTLVIRRGDFRKARSLDLKEASPYVARDILRERSDRLWSNYIDQARSKIVK